MPLSSCLSNITFLSCLSDTPFLSYLLEISSLSCLFHHAFLVVPFSACLSHAFLVMPFKHNFFSCLSEHASLIVPFSMYLPHHAFLTNSVNCSPPEDGISIPCSYQSYLGPVQSHKLYSEVTVLREKDKHPLVSAHSPHSPSPCAIHRAAMWEFRVDRSQTVMISKLFMLDVC